MTSFLNSNLPSVRIKDSDGDEATVTNHKLNTNTDEKSKEFYDRMLQEQILQTEIMKEAFNSSITLKDIKWRIK